MHSDDECVPEHSEEEPEFDPFSTDPEEWQDYHSQFLVTLWQQLTDQVAAMGVYVLDRCHISDFTEFCFTHSSGRKPPC